MRRAGVVGLGGMGKALTESLLSHGYPVTCFDRKTEAVAVICMHGASPAESAREVAEESDVVFTFLPGPAEVLEVALNPEAGVLAGLAEGGAMIDMSTCTPEVATELDARFREARRGFVDCPVSGKAPNMSVLVGGKEGVLGDNTQVIQDVSGRIIYCGASGAGYAVKLLNQHVKYSSYLAASEALLVATKMGLDAAQVSLAIEQCSGGEPGLTTAAEYYRNDMRAMRRHAPASTIEKDMLLAEGMASLAGVDTPSLKVVAEFFRQVGATEFRQRPYPESNEYLNCLRTSSAMETGL